MRWTALARNIVFATIAAATWTANAQDAASAQRFLESIYARYHKGGTPVSIFGKHAELVFASSLIFLERADEKAAGSGYVGVLDFDPICACQDDAEIRNLRIDVGTPTQGHAEAQVSFDAQDGTHTALTFVLAEQGGKWRVYNILDRSGPGQPFSLRAELIKARGTYPKDKK